MDHSSNYRDFKYVCFSINAIILMKLYSKQFIIFLIIILILAIISFGKEGYRYFKITQEIKGLEQEIENLKKNNEEFIKIKDFLQSQEFLEQEAKKKLGYVKEGENVIVIASAQSDLEQENQVIPNREISNFQLWWKYFFDHD